jgi:hypothetical protein
MKRTILLTFIALLSSPAFGQGQPGIGVGVGWSQEAKLSLTAEYFHPLPLKQFYAVAGFSFSNSGTQVTDDIHNMYFSGINRLFLGIQIGDYLFALPRVSYNIYGKYTSVGWGFTGGMRIHPHRIISFGFGVAYDRLRFDSTLDRFGPVSATTVGLDLQFSFI